MQSGDGVGLGCFAPSPLDAGSNARAADGPSAEADLADFGAGFAEDAIVHVRVSRFWFLVSRSLALTPLRGSPTGRPRHTNISPSLRMTAWVIIESHLDFRSCARSESEAKH